MFTAVCRVTGLTQLLKHSISQRPATCGLQRRFFGQSDLRQTQSQCDLPYLAPTLDAQHPPLRILYCGSDHFSATSLKALHQEHLSDASFIRSIDVVTKKPKAVNRGLREVREAPIKRVATELGLRAYEIDTFRNWEPPDNDPEDPINLIIAVSFGLFVPPRLLDRCLYGGINVHPSLLPMYRGAAPIYHTLLNKDPFTGVTVQTLSPVAFDQGAILIQSHEIPIPPGTSYSSLHDHLALTGANLLVHTCRERLFAPPITPIYPPYEPSYAPKINSELHARIDWSTKDASEVERYCGVLGRLWGRFGEHDMLDRRKRIIFSHIEQWRGEQQLPEEDVKPGSWQHQITQDGPGILLVKCKTGGGWVRVGGVKVEGRHLRDGGEWAQAMVMSGKGYMRFT